MDNPARILFPIKYIINTSISDRDPLVQFNFSDERGGALREKGQIARITLKYRSALTLVLLRGPPHGQCMRSSASCNLPRTRLKLIAVTFDENHSGNVGDNNDQSGDCAASTSGGMVSPARKSLSSQGLWVTQ